jgi:hypothetical protein
MKQVFFTLESLVVVAEQAGSQHGSHILFFHLVL